jgi:hypothetical protein
MGETVRSHLAWQLGYLVAVGVAGKTLGCLNFEGGPFSETEWSVLLRVLFATIHGRTQCG